MQHWFVYGAPCGRGQCSYWASQTHTPAVLHLQAMGTLLSFSLLKSFPWKALEQLWEFQCNGKWPPGCSLAIPWDGSVWHPPCWLPCTHLSPAPGREGCDPRAVPAPRSKRFHEGNPFVLPIWLSNRTWLQAWSWHQMKNVHFKHFILTLMGMGNSSAHFCNILKK